METLTVSLPVLVVAGEDGRLGLSVQTDGLIDALVDTGLLEPDELGYAADAILNGRVHALPVDVHLED